MKWKMVGKSKAKGKSSKASDVIEILLKNRGLKTKKDRKKFFSPLMPDELSLKELKISQDGVDKAIQRIKKAKKNKEKIIVFGDYDADGVCATAIMWETLHYSGCDVMPYIPDRFSEGYGISTESIENLTSSYPNLKLIITVDNGIVSNNAIDAANEQGIDVIITDHHIKGKKLPKAHSIIHTTQIGGAGIAWIMSREVLAEIPNTKYSIQNSLELAAIGTIADQLPLLGPNRSFAKHGLEALNNTQRPGLIALYEKSGILRGPTSKIGTYEVNFIIAPRINAMGRMEHAIDSLRLLCTRSRAKASELSHLLNETNLERQKTVEKVVLHAKKHADKKDWKGAIVLAHESYHEGVIGLAASKLVEEFYRPAIIFFKGSEFSKASGRSIPGFNIIDAIRQLDNLTEGGGGHPMAAGFSIKTEKLDTFIKEFDDISQKNLNDEVLEKVLKIDMELEFDQINDELVENLVDFEPTGIGNPRPVFASRNVNVLASRTVGYGAKHLKVQFEKKGQVFSSIGFGLGHLLPNVLPDAIVDVSYNLEENVWKGKREIQLRIKDIKPIN